jgi:hypothetical protein
VLYEKVFCAVGFSSFGSSYGGTRSAIPETIILPI